MASLNGTVRTLEPHVREEMQRLLTEIATMTARAHGAEAVVEYDRGYPCVVNDGCGDGTGRRSQPPACWARPRSSASARP